MHSPLSLLIASLLPVSLAAPAPFAPPPSLANDYHVAANIFDATALEAQKVKIIKRTAIKGKKRSCAAKPNVSQPVFLATPLASLASSAVSSPTISAAAAASSAVSANSTLPVQGMEDTATNLLAELFPVQVSNKWTTAVNELGSLSFDSALKPLTAGHLPDSTAAPDGTLGLHASFPANTFKYSAATGAGFSFYSPGPSDVDVSSATEVTLSYSVYFSQGFDFVKGGKLPGLYGGTSLAEAKSCSGGRQDERATCFSARLMWRTDGAGEFYNYFPIGANQPADYCSIAPKSVCDASFGDSIGRGSFYFTPGEWTTVTQRLKLNSPASASNGEQELWVNGKQVLNLSGLQIRTNDQTKIYGIMAQTFFGGGDASWASPKDQDAWFKDWSMGIIA